MLDPDELFDAFEAGTAFLGDLVPGPPGVAIRTAGVLARIVHDGLSGPKTTDQIVNDIRAEMVAASDLLMRRTLGP